MPPLLLSIAVFAAPPATWKTPERIGDGPPATRFVTFDADHEGVCALDADGQVWCAGRVAGSTAFTPVSGLPRGEHVRVGYDGVCTWRVGAPAACVRSSAAFSPSPVLAATDRPLRAFEDVGACATGIDGVAHCPGRPIPAGVGAAVRVAHVENGFVWLDAEDTLRFVPEEGTGAGALPEGFDLPDVVDFAVYQGVGCALDRRQRVHCWGIPTKRRSPSEKRPVIRIRGLKAPTRIAVSHRSACAVVAGGRVRCWGSPVGLTGRKAKDWLGARDPYDLGVSGVADVRLSPPAVAVLTTDGRVLTTGKATVVTPRPIATLDGPIAHLGWVKDGACAITAAGATTCWGRDMVPGDVQPGVPTPMKIPPALAVSDRRDMGARSLCVLRRGGMIMCWPRPVTGLHELEVATGLPSDAPPHALTPSASGLCAAAGGELRCIQPGQAPGAPSWHIETVATGARDVAAHCALLADGTVRCKPAYHGQPAPRPLVGPPTTGGARPRVESIFAMARDTYLRAGGAVWRYHHDRGRLPKFESTTIGPGPEYAGAHFAESGDGALVGLPGVRFSHHFGGPLGGCGAVDRTVWCWGHGGWAFGPWGQHGLWTEYPTDAAGRPSALTGPVEHGTPAGRLDR